MPDQTKRVNVRSEGERSGFGKAIKSDMTSIDVVHAITLSLIIGFNRCYDYFSPSAALFIISLADFYCFNH